MRWVMLIALFLAGAAFMPVDHYFLPYPQGYFRWPVDHTVRLSGTFGELRPNHFHAGVDIRSAAHRIGDPLYAAAEGYVARIQVEENGYGKSLLIVHPNGYSSLYGHMDRFTEDLEAFVKHEQYKQKCFEVEIAPPPHFFTFRQGQYIGNMGNTGASAGPHLHFEVRETATDKPVNPLLFGLPITDNLAPQVYTLKVYQMEGLGVFGTRTRDYDVDPNAGHFHAEPETLTVNTPFAAFAVKAFDMHDSPSNRNGIFAVQMKVDDLEAYTFSLNEVPFENTRYINAHMDYEEQVTARSYFHRCFLLPGNMLHIYSMVANHGIVPLLPGELKKVEISVADALGNESLLRFWVRREGAGGIAAMPGPYQYYVYHDRDNILQPESCSVFLPRGTVYEDLPLGFRTAPASGSGYLSDIFHIHNYLTPVHSYYVLSLTANRTLKETDRGKAFIAYLDPRGRVLNCGGVWKDDVLTTTVRQFGPYAIMVDKTPPSVSPSVFGYDMRGKKFMSFRVSDNYSTAPNMEKMGFYATVDGKWILMEFEKKTGLLVHHFDQRIPAGKHLLRLEVTDAMGNITVYEKHFLR